MPFINKTKRFVFLGVPKCASTSMYKTLNELCKGDDIVWGGLQVKPDEYHMPLFELLKKYPYTKDYFKFAFVRNPYSRFLSVYLDGKTNKGHLKTWSSELLKYKSFEDFCIHFHETKVKNDIHFLGSTYFVGDGDNNTGIDFIGRFENLNEDFKYICKKTNLKYKDLHKTRKTKHKHFTEHYTPQTSKIIETYYIHDFKAFGYGFINSS